MPLTVAGGKLHSAEAELQVLIKQIKKAFEIL